MEARGTDTLPAASDAPASSLDGTGSSVALAVRVRTADGRSLAVDHSGCIKVGPVEGSSFLLGRYNPRSKHSGRVTLSVLREGAPWFVRADAQTHRPLRVGRKEST